MAMSRLLVHFEYLFVQVFRRNVPENLWNVSEILSIPWRRWVWVDRFFLDKVVTDLCVE